MFKLTKDAKGFTFVELAIVLVIIGIIMGLAVKGRTLIRGAKLRAEIRKIDKLQTALMSYINLYKGVLPDYDSGSSAPYSIDYNLFLEQDLIKMSDMLASYNSTPSISSTPNTYAIWGYAMCGINFDATDPDNESNNTSFYSDECKGASDLMVCPNICVVGMKLNADRTVDYSPILKGMKCSIEAMADDRDYKNGAGRTSTGFEDMVYLDTEICSQEMDYSDFAPSQADVIGSTYTYRIY
jgi:prepilin-type N-terminal cleavage/methylation domain-containing protein